MSEFSKMVKKLYELEQMLTLIYSDVSCFTEIKKWPAHHLYFNGEIFYFDRNPLILHQESKLKLNIDHELLYPIMDTIPDLVHEIRTHHEYQKECNKKYKFHTEVIENIISLLVSDGY